MDLLSFLGVETIHKRGIEKRAVLPVVKGILGGVLKGLCSSCGKNLNAGPCDCKPDTVDPRLEVLKQLIK